MYAFPNSYNKLILYIHNYRYGACDDLTIYTINPNTTMFMYQYSDNVNIYNPYGYINDVDTGEQNLFCGDLNENTYIGSYRNASEAIDGLLRSSSLACGSIKFHCHNFNQSDDSCEMIQTPVDNTDFLSIGGGVWQCYPTALTNLYKNSCLGTCPNSPTSAPTTAPSFSPTAVTIDPTNAPSVSPSLTPTLAPSIPPTNAPSLAPSLTPTLAPSTTPTSPTGTPSVDPTVAPTTAPTETPSIAPSLAPTLAPTRMPTVGGRFDRFINIIYKLGKLTSIIKKHIASNRHTVIPIIQSIMERGYLTDGILGYEDFEVKVRKINEDKVENIKNDSWLFWGKEGDPLSIECDINCLYDNCVFIANKDMTTQSNANGNRRLLSGSVDCDVYHIFKQGFNVIYKIF